MSHLENLEEPVVQKLKTARYILSTIESCTGGLISHLITNVPGASEIFYGASVVYDNSFKQELGVAQDLLKEKGAVSAEVAQELAEQGLKRMKNNLFLTSSYALVKGRGFVCVSTTGIAGPSGGTKEKPVGLCYIGLAISNQKTRVEKFHATGTELKRSEIKIQFAKTALGMICNALDTIDSVKPN